MDFSIKPSEHNKHVQLIYIDGEYLGASIRRNFSKVTILWYSGNSKVEGSMDWVAVFSSKISNHAEFTSGWSTSTQMWKQIEIKDSDGSVLKELKKYGFIE